MSVLDAPRAPSVSPAAPEMDAAAAYVHERESKRLRGLDVPKHRAFAADAGRYVFAGRREVAGCALVLLQREDKEIVVLKVQDSRQLSWWAKQRIGRSVTVDAFGHARGRGR